MLFYDYIYIYISFIRKLIIFISCYKRKLMIRFEISFLLVNTALPEKVKLFASKTTFLVGRYERFHKS